MSLFIFNFRFHECYSFPVLFSFFNFPLFFLAAFPFFSFLFFFFFWKKIPFPPPFPLILFWNKSQFSYSLETKTKKAFLIYIYTHTHRTSFSRCSFLYVRCKVGGGGEGKNLENFLERRRRRGAISKLKLTFRNMLLLICCAFSCFKVFKQKLVHFLIVSTFFGEKYSKAPFWIPTVHIYTTYSRLKGDLGMYMDRCTF